MGTPPLAGWENFYVIVGSSAGGLTGLTFVVIALVRDMRRVRLTGLRTFVTPIIVHFGWVLALAAFMSMPHQHLWSLSAGLAIAGLAGLIYTGVITANMPGPGSEYVPVREDWIFNVIVPGAVYGCLAIAAVLLWYYPVSTLYGIAALSLVMLFTGIRNAWDIAVWMTIQGPPDRS